LGFVRSYLKGEADLWWATVKERQNELSFGWVQFKELIKNCFYPMSLQQAKAKEFLELKQGKMSVL